jgi:PPOX class probable F420-dependent enzyme
MLPLRTAAQRGHRLTWNEDRYGSLEVGKVADMAVLAEDPLSCDLDRLKDIRIERTFPGGREVFGSPRQGPPAGARVGIEASMLSEDELRFLADRRIAHLATADRSAIPHVVPVCFALAEGTLYITIDEKPKRRSGTALKRLRNIVENPAVAVIADRYDEDWARLGWVMLRGRAEILAEGAEHDDAQALLRLRYPQLNAMRIARHPVIAIRIEQTASWGNLAVTEA